MGWVIAFVVGATCTWWALGATFARPDIAEISDQDRVLYEVQAGVVQQQQTFTAAAQWALREVTRNSASGTVTDVSIDPGQTVTSGDVLYMIDLRPVVAAEGAIPAFRDMLVGSSGGDVLQLEQMLADTGYSPGDIDGAFTIATRLAVEEWQSDLGLTVTGRVALGDVIYFPRLPRRVMLGREIAVGQRLAPGSPTISVLPSAPNFDVALDVDQSGLVPLDAHVRVRFSGHVWRGRIGEASESNAGELVLNLVAPDGGPLCGRRCNQVPVGRRVLMPCEVITVPRTSGPLVPNAALRTTPGGTTIVVGDDGSEIPVRVVASANGSSIVSGIQPGDRVNLFAMADGSAEG